jgi:hypothetical protein
MKEDTEAKGSPEPEATPDEVEQEELWIEQTFRRIVAESRGGENGQRRGIRKPAEGLLSV